MDEKNNLFNQYTVTQYTVCQALQKQLFIGLQEVPYWSGYSKPRLLLHAVVTSKYFDLCIAGVIGVNVITMALEFYLMPAVGPFHIAAAMLPLSTYNT